MIRLTHWDPLWNEKSELSASIKTFEIEGLYEKNDAESRQTPADVEMRERATDNNKGVKHLYPHNRGLLEWHASPVNASYHSEFGKTCTRIILTVDGANSHIFHQA